jgi:hypothetical protein
MDKLTSQLEKINKYVNSKNELLTDIHIIGRIEETHRKAFEKAINDKIFTNNELRKILTFVKVTNFILNFQKKIIDNLESAKIQIDGIFNRNSKERQIFNLLTKLSISINHVSIMLKPDLDYLNLTDQEFITLYKFSHINPNEIKIDLVDYEKERIKNAKEVLTVELIRQLLDIVNKYNLIDRIYLVFFYNTANTLSQQLELFLEQYSSEISNISYHDKKKSNILEIIDKVKTNNTFLFALMKSYPNEYKLLINHLKSDKDLDGKNKQIQIEEKTFANFKWIALEGRNLHIQKVISILVLCSMKNWLSKKWSEISTIDKENIIKNTFDLTIKHQNFHPEKINSIESDILTINDKGIDYDKSLKYLSFLECFIKKGEFLQKLK